MTVTPRPPRQTLVVLIMFALGGFGCSGTTTSPSAGTPPGTPAIVALTLDSSRILTGRESAPAVFVELQGGTRQGVAAALATSNGAVISVTPSGMLKGENLGTATVTASYRGFTATRSMTVEPDYTGVWSTFYTVTACADHGEFLASGWCRQVSSGPMPVSIGLGRVGAGVNVYRSLEGTAVFGSVPCRLTLRVNDDGSASGHCSFSLYSPSFTLEIGDDRVFLYSPVEVPITLKWDRFSLGSSFPWIVFLSSGSLVRQTNQLLPGGTWDPGGVPAAVTAFPSVSSTAQLIDRFRR